MKHNLFSKFKIKYYDNIDLCIKDAKVKNVLSIFFIEKDKEKNFLSNINKFNFPSIFISELSFLHNIPPHELREKLDMPFSILELRKKIILLIAKTEFKKNSLIQLKDYTIDKNERKIKKNNLEIKLSEKEINFLILFTYNKEPITRNEVLKLVWNYSSESETHTIETHIHRLRKKILKNLEIKIL